MKVTQDELQTLLQLAQLDRDLAKTRQVLGEVKSSEAVARISGELGEVNELVAANRAELDRTKDALRKLENDVELVEKRLRLDKERLNTLSNAKDVTGVQHEIQSLQSRISLLEDQELELMEIAQESQRQLDENLDRQSELNHSLLEVQSSEQQEMVQLSKKLSEFESQRGALLTKLNDDLAASYVRKAERSTAAARLLGRDCGACMLALTSAAYDDVMATPQDELPTCPNCQALIIR